MSGVDVTVQLEDVDDLVSFCGWIVRTRFATNGQLTPDERRDVVSEAVCLALQLHDEWEPERCERFSAYLLSYLPRRLVDWWRKELRQSGRGRWDGRAGVCHYFGTVSLDATVSDDARPVELAESGAPPPRGQRQHRELTTPGPGE